jgi:competence protein ComEC
MNKYHIPYWKDAPFIRIIIPFICGIATGYYLAVPERLCCVLSIIFLTILFAYAFLNIELKFRFRYAIGMIINFFLLSTGAHIAAIKNPFKNADCIPTSNEGVYIVTLLEPLSEKKSSWKALCALESIRTADAVAMPSANLLLYIKKEGGIKLPHYGNRLAFKKPPERIKNFAEGSAFDYVRYCALKNIHYQVFLKPSDIILLEGENKSPLHEFLFKTQHWVISILQQYIIAEKECGLAEALLIGYKNNLDRKIIQSYSNTGVVHVVAISGLHLGLVYSILSLMCKPFKRKPMRSLIILTGLWLFTLLAGGSPSVLRSAVMFSSLVIGENVARRSSVINNLSVSAFFLLCYDPYWLWDLGFILSYSALLSIVLFMKPLYNIYISENKIIDMAWKLNAVTISAQVLTFPVLIHCFGQFPNLFIITNFLAVPLSSLILLGEIALCAIYFVEPMAKFFGFILTKLIRLMNGIVEYVDNLPYASTKNIHLGIPQVVLLYVFIAFACHWLAGKHKSWQ